MTERLINSSCSFADGVAEIAALPEELRVFVGNVFEIKNCPVPAEVHFPSYCVSVALGGRVVVTAIDVALLRQVYGDGGIPRVVEFVLSEIKASVEGLLQEVQKDKAA